MEDKPINHGLGAIPDADRQAAVNQIQQAIAYDVIPFEEADARLSLAYSAATLSELAQATTGLDVPAGPVPDPESRHLTAPQTFTLVGDTKIGGWVALSETLRAITGIGDTTIDLAAAALPAQGLKVDVYTLIGDTKVIVPDGVRLQIETTQILGCDKTDVVQPRPGAPVVKLNIVSLIGDAKIYSMSRVPEGPLRRLWKSLRRSPQDSLG